MSLPTSNDYQTVAKWLTREPSILEYIKTRLSPNHIEKFVEIEDEEAFLKLCTKCKVPVILHLKESTEDEDPECDNLLSKLVDNFQIPLRDNAELETFMVFSGLEKSH